ncbi:hypothetical protein CC99x_011985 [Candidatus Berkiella cookevillensis]|uniref:Uncharacterized protein n=1 Tax=Candidatus Berkiella cookevillensis TaxID=437022 RepID=A0A0Q9YDV1_9GAMM|nr:hypothetical protein [Candidatus Berkiella cookevillensis]MCS5709616.1 hypothetical protein [Candidatus Berkiella cookevillensis]
MNLGPKHGVSESLHGIPKELEDKYAEIFVLLSDFDRYEELDALQKKYPALDVLQQYQLYRLVRNEVASEKQIWDELKAKRAQTLLYRQRNEAQEQPRLSLSTSSDDSLVHSPAFDEEKEKISGSKNLKLSR